MKAKAMVRSLRISSLVGVFFLLIFAISGQCLADEAAVAKSLHDSGLAYAAKGDYEQAMTNLQRVLDEYYPDSAQVKMIFMRGQGRDVVMVPVKRENHLKALERGR